MNRIKQLREELKISQSDLAKKLNKTQQMVSLYENGTYEPDLDSYILLSKLFDCSIEYIAGKSDIHNIQDIDFSKDDIHIKLKEADKGYMSDNVKQAIQTYIKFIIEEEKRKKKK